MQDEARCPNCASYETRAIRDAANALRSLLQVLLVVICGVIALLAAGIAPDVPALRHRRLCLQCGARFGKRVEGFERDACAKCGHPIRGTDSPKCLECGWVRPTEFRRSNAAPRPPSDLPLPSDPAAIAALLGRPLPRALVDLHAAMGRGARSSRRDFFFRHPAGSDRDVYVSQFLPLRASSLGSCPSFEPALGRLPFATDGNGGEYFVDLRLEQEPVFRYDRFTDQTKPLRVSISDLLSYPTGQRGGCPACRRDCSRIASTHCPDCGGNLPSDNAA